MTVLPEEQGLQGVTIGVVVEVTGDLAGLSAVAAAQGIGHLVLQDGKHPGLEGGLAAEGRRLVEGGHIGVLDDIFGQAVIAQLPGGIAEHLGAEGRHLLGDVHGRGGMGKGRGRTGRLERAPFGRV